MPMVPVELSRRINAIFDEEIARAQANEDPAIRSALSYTLLILHSKISRAETDTMFEEMVTDGKVRGRKGLQGRPWHPVARGIVLLDPCGRPHGEVPAGPQNGPQQRERDRDPGPQGPEDHTLGGSGPMRAYLCSACLSRACESYTEDGSIPTICPYGEPDPVWKSYGEPRRGSERCPR